jgi:positive regulator of sigma E activity
MQTEQGTVLELLGGGWAKIKVNRGTTCQTCSGNGSCCEPFGHDSMIVVAQNRVAAQIGQDVEIEFASVSRGKAMGVLYIIPLAALLVGAILGYNLELFGSRDGSTALFGILFLVASFFGIYWYNTATWAKDTKLQPYIVRILPSGAAGISAS